MFTTQEGTGYYLQVQMMEDYCHLEVYWNFNRGASCHLLVNLEECPEKEALYLVFEKVGGSCVLSLLALRSNHTTSKHWINTSNL